jgi:hypothetical protein
MEALTEATARANAASEEFSGVMDPLARYLNPTGPNASITFRANYRPLGKK